MGRMCSIGRRLRPITAVIVLYAVVLQGVLGGLMPIRMLDHTGYLCAQGTEAARDDEGPVKSPPHHVATCCIAAHAALDAGTPLPAAAIVAWPPREAGLAIRNLETRVAARAPPGSIPLARGPPAA